MNTNIPNLKHQIEALSTESGDLHVLALSKEIDLAAEHSCSVQTVELAALESGIVPTRYARNIGTVGITGQMRLLQATVAVVGLGGLGGYVVEALARMGVGHLILIDHDAYDEHNLNRQVLSNETNLGTPKAEMAYQHVAAINSAVEITHHVTQLTAENLADLLHPADVVVDALDNLPTRITLQKGTQALNIPVVHGSIAGFLGQVMTIFPEDGGLLNLYGDDPKRLPQRGLEAQVGTPAATPMAIAAWEAQETIKIITGCGKLLRHKMMIMDMENGSTDFLILEPEQPGEAI